MTSHTDWQRWHAPYADPASPLSRRLRVVQAAIAAWLDSPGRGSRVLSACAGDGRDVIGVLAERRSQPSPSGTLIELDPAARARASARAAGLRHLAVRCADAGLSDSYVGAVPADLALLCGILGNISDGDAEELVRAAPRLCAPGATVIWTRSRRAPDLTPRIRRWFANAGFAEQSFVAPEEDLFTVGVHVFGGIPQPLVPGTRLFSFER